MNPPSPALKPFLETIEDYCRALERQSLITLILGLARQVEPGGRDDFLHLLQCILPGKEEVEGQPGEADVKQVLEEIKSLRQEIQARINSIEDGSYWDDPDEDDWEDSYSYDEDPEPLNDFQQEGLASFFSRADHYFLRGEQKTAQTMYVALFSLVSEVEACDFYCDFGLDLREERARYARCVYDGKSGEERLAAMAVVMGVDSGGADFEGLGTREFPSLREVKDAEVGELADFETFLSDWEKVLGGYDYKVDRVADLHLEARFLQDGAAGVGELAETWQAEQPRGYLFWLKQIEEEEDWSLVREAAGKAIAVLPFGEERYQAAGYLVRAGKHLEEDETLLTGNRERFQSAPNDATLLALVAEADRQQVRAQELVGVAVFLSKSKSGPVGRGEALLVKALIMNGELDRALARCKKQKAVGWSYGTGIGLFYGSVLYLLCRGKDSCTLGRQLLKDYSGGRDVFFSGYDEDVIDSDASGFQEIKRGLEQFLDSSPDCNRFREWAEHIGEQRVNHLVSNKHRKAYDRAAMILGALAECMAAEGNRKKAQSLLHDYCRVRYNRHTAFRREVRAAVGASEMLKGMGGEL